VELDGRVVAESSEPRLLFETHLPVRFYLSPNDILVELIASARRTYCAYKGEARYWTIEIGSKTYRDIAWSYAAPLRDGEYIRDRIAFFDEKVDVVLDGKRRPRPSGAVSAAILEEAGV
jgi:uncharacterized protein (DUF427 family)